LWSDGSYTSFDYPAAAFTEATGINALGVVVGIFTDSSGNTHGFIRTP
jgi:probable HAF family extracellular repeat protein